MARSIPKASEEFADADLGDERLDRRLLRLADCVAVAPTAGFPRVSSSESELRSVARIRPDAPASEALTEQQVRVLHDLSRIEDPRVRKVTIPAAPTAQHALAAVAQLGGHLKRNGPPGWQVLGRGYESLLLLELGWRARAPLAAQKST